MSSKFLLGVFLLSLTYSQVISQSAPALQRTEINRQLDSIYLQVKEAGAKDMLVFYTRGVRTEGLLLWRTDEKESGIAFQEKQGRLNTKKVKRKYLTKYAPFDKYLDNIGYLKSEPPPTNFTSHDYEVVWMYDNASMVDSTSLMANHILTNGLTPLSDIYFSFFNLYLKSF